MTDKPKKEYRKTGRKPRLGTKARHLMDQAAIVDKVIEELAPKTTAGRPKVKIDWVQFHELCKMQATIEEICAVMRIDDETLRRRAKEEFQCDFAAVYKRLAADGRYSLRRKQVEIAKDGNTAMLIWLGKQYMSQRDKPADEQEPNKALSQLVSAIGKIRDATTTEQPAAIPEPEATT